MGFNKRRMESERAAAAAKKSRRVGPWAANIRGCPAPGRDLERAPRGPHADAVFADNRRRHPGRHWFLGVRCQACRTVSAVDLRGLDRHPDAAVTSLIPWLSCRSCGARALCRTDAFVVANILVVRMYEGPREILR